MTSQRTWTLLTTLILAVTSLVPPHIAAAPTGTQGPTACVTFDINWNLLAFGVDGKDYNAGTRDTWSASGTPTDITKPGRPPFDSQSVACYLSQFFNAIYVVNGDSKNPSSIYIFDVTAQTWSVQATEAGTFDFSNFETILDRDTNVFYAYSNGGIFSLDMGSLKSANSTAIKWNDAMKPDLSFGGSTEPDAVQTPGANTDNYTPTIALADNHVHFLGLPGAPEGTLKIFVIHYNYMQPAPQAYTPAFPTSHGKAASFFKPEGKGVQQEFAFIPDDGSATYVINVQTNRTKTLPGPPGGADKFATYAASTDALVQLNTKGKVSFVAYDPEAAAGGGTWSSVAKLPSATLSTGGPNGGSLSGNGTGGNSTDGNGPTGAAAALSVGSVLGLAVGGFGALLGLIL